MAAEYSEAPPVEEIARELIARYHTHLLEARIAYLWRDGPWTRSGKTVFGGARRVSGIHQALCEKDFVIAINQEAWVELTPAQRRALVDHELSHCERGDDDKDGNPTWQIAQHDFEEFTGVLRRHGPWTTTLKHVAEAIDAYRQQSFELEPDVEEVSGQEVAMAQ